ncbi:hypothetical protein CesoFtcFv8_004826 [Champsocephalus esox]|uniref:Uncharacterized protein n=1 Tax=Champsocephalus esox TaxID=159716 RepID=A0AAN8HBW9_9TELE|nr:hypothetical protein CesoFtcFv8_004826 [Champsocephalus esox]
MANMTPRLYSRIIRLTVERKSHRNTLYSSCKQSHRSPQCVYAAPAVSGDWSRYTAAGAGHSRLSHLSDQSGDSMADRKPITHSVPPDPD